MDYYSKRNNYSMNTRRSYYQNEQRPNRKKDIDLDTLIIDENTVYELDDECIKKYMKSSVSRKNKK